MEISISSEGTLGRKLHIKVPYAEFEGKFKEEVQAVCKKVRLDGFRPGKAPPQVVEQRFGSTILSDVAQDVIKDSYIEALQKEQLNPAGEPHIEDISISPNRDISFVASIEIYPELADIAVDQLVIEKPTAEITEQDVLDMVEQVRARHKKWKEVARAAASGDRVTFDYTRADQAPGEGKDMQVELSDDNSSEWIAQLVGMASGETKTVQIETAQNEDESAEHKAYDVDVKLTKVEEGTLPELNDAFFKECDVTEGGLEGLHKMLREGMQIQLDESLKKLIEEHVVDALLMERQIDLPQRLVKKEIEQRRQKMIDSGLAAEEVEQVSDDVFKPHAERVLGASLLFRKIATQYDIKVDEQTMQASMDRIASAYKDPESVKQYYYDNEDAYAYLEGVALGDMVLDHILNTAKVSEKSYSFDEIMAQKTSTSSG